jgi:hypothetical protein
MRKAEYHITIKDDRKAEQILNEIDLAMIRLERKHPELKVQT